ncbi:LysR family transcriptional regulator [Falsibacillus albus]|uniref:LysR family transcriptional regulator n=1 Tax=Falsibacillus albus TaxID=2478915 RepID=A0A3L7K5M9_9BACI|nr:LysR family transcriptional regulator [Falsibacillus albus]RLQ97381.1 LysR family transcriptional regulator [Falsibacillus albus]
MNIKQLRYFSTFAEEGQITKAAKKLFMAQPPLSQQLKLLEEELGVELIHRNGRKLELTEAGIVLYQKAKKILEDVDETIMEVRETGEGIRGVLAIGSVKTCFHHIPYRIRNFQEKFPQLSFKLIEGDTFRLQHYLKEKEIEVAVVRLPMKMKEYSHIPLPTDHFVAILPEDWMSDPDMPCMTLEELAKLPMMLLHRAGEGERGLYELVLDAFKEKNLKPHVVCECPDAAMLLSLVRAGVGITLLPKSTLHAFPPQGVKVVEISGEVIKSESAVIWLKDRYLSKNAVRFIETFSD